MQSFLMHTKVEIRLLFRDIIGLFFVFVMPALSFYFFSQMFQSQDPDQTRYFNHYIPGMIGIVLFTSGFFIIGLEAVSDREKGYYKRLIGTPVKPIIIFQAIITKGFIAVALAILEIMVIARIALSVPLKLHVYQFIIALLIASAAFFAVGFIIASITRRFQSAMAIGFVMLYPMLFLSGAIIPIESLPSSFHIVTLFIPLTYAVHLLQNGWEGQLFTESSIADVTVMLCIFFVGIVLSRKFFRLDME
ncbi:ABC transporter permease [Paenibacillus xylaniclasticus]|uniref:ABC transporter permease n=1 Tax=Paenibacillus xylaniclasticus TaxID=588083 RepID=UPI000FDACD0B|nr:MULTISPECIES: ABC transporter permease [Paenibacillus]GFN33111.1 transport permease protein [Paenibacillus curdlanolyticus]